jgi:tetratricopeptide (TPR) repeat protein
MKRFSFLLICISLSIQTFGQFKLYEKGVDSYKNGKFPESINLFNEYLTKVTRDKALDVQVYYLRALANFKLKNYSGSLSDFQDALLLNHENTGNIYWFMGKCQENLGDANEAISMYSKALKSLQTSDNATRAKLLFDRSQAYIKVTDPIKAQEDLVLANAIHPENADVKRELDKILPVASRATEKKLADSKAGEITADQKAKVTETPVEKKPEPKIEEPKKEVAKTEDIAQNKPDEKPPVKTELIQPQVVSPPPAEVPTVKTPTLADIYKDEKRYALVIGNSAYPKEIGVLKNPVNDATDIAKELENSKFDVQLLTNATYGQMRAAMLKFKEKVDAGEKDKTVALFYYAGHGLQQEDENYLVPVDASIEFEDDISRFCFPVQRMVLTNMERSNSRMNIVILDACRNNPFPSLTRSLGDEGLTEMKRARGSFIAYATAPGSVASDGTGRNGLYTQELLKSLRKPGLTIEQVFKDVRQNVLRLSGDRQNTWDSSNIIGEFYFKF